MGKSRQMKDRTRDPVVSDYGTTSQGFPRKYREHLKFVKSIETKAELKKSISEKKTKKGLNGKLITTKDQLHAKEDELRRIVNHTAKSITNKYAKRKAWMEQHKGSKKNGKSNEEEYSNLDGVQQPFQRGLEVEKKLVDHVEFGQIVQRPPNITVKPKARKEYVPMPKKPLYDDANAADEDKLERARRLKRQKEQAIESGTFSDTKIGRKRKLKDLAPVEKIALLREREQVIALYRQSKMLHEQSKTEL
ncbi:hypothetical protein BATDEDRAFT_21535 [Batrachochytrium dendrobatidis JAM81]|uniref:Uncharacterized protein n=2 Tax=Batrachochytrium dendrobatidis TaxID=109871 RepID=F4NTR0_BATDJ|nr:uncharacterized protein BATDEDRAFT_21535 [Batrachochytrium dendrobatidis JAM81]EGF83940.1 hypothetical protein BATDEDRAFT_21535 [Batrachochytrium dendrobatidis JAM81]KAJ8331301.1 hypothetical protein O5D80_000234 [Batrachochytrium dendrobatidis]KAK5671752.1 hypothetical protein QVD99_001587 [Batrachochytrium dendrobatidis]OAJ36247.1 hypothetical protein BDEG_20440 [Batrachochytrium dendrobatidis JEL423]|eukprot:XP_006675312.1 hypothetical protein BATDEDRAFT_21535 [Batrachochytrium dendrobatidis JAM81]